MAERIQKMIFSEDELRTLLQALSIADNESSKGEATGYKELTQRVEMALEVIEYRRRASDMSRELGGDMV